MFIEKWNRSERGCGSLLVSFFSFFLKRPEKENGDETLPRGEDGLDGLILPLSTGEGEPELETPPIFNDNVALLPDASKARADNGGVVSGEMGDEGCAGLCGTDETLFEL